MKKYMWDREKIKMENLEYIFQKDRMLEILNVCLKVIF